MATDTITATYLNHSGCDGNGNTRGLRHATQTGAAERMGTHHSVTRQWWCLSAPRRPLNSCNYCVVTTTIWLRFDVERQSNGRRIEVETCCSHRLSRQYRDRSGDSFPAEVEVDDVTEVLPPSTPPPVPIICVFENFRRKFTNLVAPPTDGTTKRIDCCKAHQIL